MRPRDRLPTDARFHETGICVCDFGPLRHAPSSNLRRTLAFGLPPSTYHRLLLDDACPSALGQPDYRTSSNDSHGTRFMGPIFKKSRVA